MSEPGDEFVDEERPADAVEDVDPEAPSDAPVADVPDEDREEPGAEPRDVMDSEPNVGQSSGLAGDMGVSSGWSGPVEGENEPFTTGAKPTGSPDPGPDAPPEQSADPRTGPEPHPDNDLPPHPFDPTSSPGHSHG